jgi:hypothetical protein
MGGLFTVSTAYKAPGLFAGHVALSPAASWDHGALARLDDAWAWPLERLLVAPITAIETFRCPW